MPAGNGIKICLLSMTLMLAVVRTAYATEDRGALDYDDIPGVLKYSQPYMREDRDGDDKKLLFSSERWWITRNTELLRRLSISEQELRQLKTENQLLRGRLDFLSVVERKIEENRNKDKQIDELKLALAKSKMQSNELVHKAEEAQGVLSQQIIELKQQLTRVDSEKKATAGQAEKEKAELQSSLNALKTEMEKMPSVTQELLKTESVQLTYAAGVMLGRDLLNIQLAQQQLGLKTDNRVLVAGIRDALNKKVLLNESELSSALYKAEAVEQKARQVVIREQKKIGAAYLEKFRKQKGVKRTESGYWYRIEYEGDGDYIRGESTVVDVVVTEKLTDGTVVGDMDAKGLVMSLPLSDYPPVFREAIMLLKNHGTVELVVPPELAYGDNGYPPVIAPGATVLYTLRIEDVNLKANKASVATPKKNKKTTAEGNEK